MEIDAAAAAALGWPKLKYAHVERERRWSCAALPADLVVGADAITDRYITGTRLRLRAMAPLGGGDTQRKLGRKADVGADTRLITTIYLTQEEFALLATLPARELRKTRHKLAAAAGIALSVDVFEGPLAGLILAEAEFDSDAAMRAYAAPAFCLREVTGDPRYTGGALVAGGLPSA